MDKVSKELENSSGKLDKPLRDENGRLLPNQPSLNPSGRPVGSRDFATDFDEVVEEIAEENGITRSQARKHLLKVAYKQAKEGNYSFYKDIHDRVYGQAVSKTELTGKDGAELPTPLLYAISNHESNKEDSQAE